MSAENLAVGKDHCHQSIVSMEGVSFSYENKKVIENLNFTILERDFVGLIGSNGAGKTTLLKMLVGLHKPEKGMVKLFGQPIEQFNEWGRIGYVPQKNSFNPLFPATVKEVVQSGLYGRQRLYRRLTQDDLERVIDALHVMRIEDLASRRIGQLSGGQQQRVFLARALVNNPQLLILDEPTVGIDAETQAGFFHMIRHMHLRHPITFIMVSHDMEMMRGYLGEGPVQESGKLKFYVKHTHDPEDCGETNLTHTLKELRSTIGV